MWCCVLEVKVLEHKPYFLRLRLKDVPLSLLNAVRRACFTDVPVMAIDIVEFFENNTVLYDEIIAHRLGLIPLTSEEALEKYASPEECRDAPLGDPKCHVVFRLEVETGPNEYRVVYSGDMESSDRSVKPLHDNIPIVVMAPNQSLRLQAYARLGYGHEHAKWMPVSIAAHKYLPVLHFDLEKSGNCEECLKCIDSFLPELAKKMRREVRGSIEILEDINTSGLNWCVVKKCGGCARLEYREGDYLLKIETTGALPARTVLLRAIEAIRRKTQKLLEELFELRKQRLREGG